MYPRVQSRIELKLGGGLHGLKTGYKDVYTDFKGIYVVSCPANVRLLRSGDWSRISWPYYLLALTYPGFQDTTLSWHRYYILHPHTYTLLLYWQCKLHNGVFSVTQFSLSCSMVVSSKEQDTQSYKSGRQTSALCTELSVGVVSLSIFGDHFVLAGSWSVSIVRS